VIINLEGATFMELMDTHVHLDEIKDIEGALTRAREANIRGIVAVGMDLISNKKILALAEKNPGFVFPALGLHPWRIKTDDLEDNFALIERELPHCLALGEVGLDFALDTPREEQVRVFRRLLEVASGMKKPVLLHARRAWAEALDLLEALKVERAVFHWYSGPVAVLGRVLARGYCISATPAAAYSEKHQEAIRATPLRLLLLETDAPEVYRGEVSEPKDLLTTIDAVSKLKKREPEEIGRETFRNAQKFFRIECPDPSGSIR
jgi:TatD DNase family protein